MSLKQSLGSKSATIESALRSAFSQVKIPQELQDAVVRAVSDMSQSYKGLQLRPAELNGGDFTEAVARVLQFMAKGQYVALGKKLPPMDKLVSSMEQSNLDDTFRIHVPCHLQAIYDVRNRRGVGHLPGPISANKPDAELVLITARWILAEFVRVLWGIKNHEEAQRAVDLLAIHEPALVEVFDGNLRVISEKKFSVPNQILIMLYAIRPNDSTLDQLCQWLSTKRANVMVALGRLDKRDLVHRFEDGRIRLTSLGNRSANNLCSLDREEVCSPL